MRFLNKNYKVTLVSCICLLITSCGDMRNFYKSNDFLLKPSKVKSINIAQLIFNLIESDKNLVPKLTYSGDGKIIYKYKKNLYEKELSLEQIEKRIKIGYKFYEKERKDIVKLLQKINDLGISNKLDFIESGALGLWIPGRNQIIINRKVVSMGSKIFLDVLSHEAIHISQSCFNGSKNSFPKRIGLPLEYSKEIDLNLSHNVYTKNSEIILDIEREAFSYSKKDGTAMKLLNSFCF